MVSRGKRVEEYLNESRKKERIEVSELKEVNPSLSARKLYLIERGREVNWEIYNTERRGFI